MPWRDLPVTGHRPARRLAGDAGRRPISGSIPFVSASRRRRLPRGLRRPFIITGPESGRSVRLRHARCIISCSTSGTTRIGPSGSPNGTTARTGRTTIRMPVPTYAQQQACMSAMINMLESTPFVERYALYNWVEDGPLPGDQQQHRHARGHDLFQSRFHSSRYSQAMPDNGTRGIAEFLFATNTWDNSGYYNNGMAMGAPTYTTGHNSQAQAIALDGANSYVQLPANIAKGSAFTFAAWVYWNGGAAWQRIFDFGTVTRLKRSRANICFSRRIPAAPRCVSPSTAAAANKSSNAPARWPPAPGSTSPSRLTATTSRSFTSTARRSPRPRAFHITPASFSPIKNYLGKSQFSADPLFNGKLDEVEIADYAMTRRPNFGALQQRAISSLHQRRLDATTPAATGARATIGAAARSPTASVASRISAPLTSRRNRDRDARQRPHHRRIEIRRHHPARKPGFCREPTR